jgi:hypothetical protein
MYRSRTAYTEGIRVAASPRPGKPAEENGPANRHGSMRTRRKLALTPAKLADAVADSPSDRNPFFWIAFRHAFPPRSTSSAETSRFPGDFAASRNRPKSRAGLFMHGLDRLYV